MMRTATLALLAGLLGVAALPLPSGSEEPREVSPQGEESGQGGEKQEPGSSDEPEPALIVYTPVGQAGAPIRRVGGGTRSGSECGEARLQAMVPADHAGRTTLAQPVLYWHASADIACRVDLTLSDVTDQSTPLLLLEKALEGPFRSGLQRLPLAALDVRLEPGRVYEWYVAIVPEPDDNSRNTVAGGGLARVEDQSARKQVSAASYARQGIWYEAFDRAGSQGRARLLDQVGLSELTLAATGPVGGRPR